MITVVTGHVGDGKTLDCVRRIRKHLAAGGCVCTNIKLDAEKIGRSVGRRLSQRQIIPLSADDDPAKIPTGDKRGHGTRKTLVVLDEALNWFQSSVGSKDTRKASWSEWLRQSDKLGQDVWFVAQTFERSAKWIRELAAVCIEIFPLKDIKIGMLFPLWLLFPPMRNMYASKWRDVRSGMVFRLELHTYSPKIFCLYDTSETFGFVGAASAYDAVRLWPRYKPLTPFVGVSLGIFACFAVVIVILLSF